MPVKAESGFGSALAILKKPRLHGALAAVAFTIVLSQVAGASLDRLIYA
jgi:hypothetical protein